MEAALAQLRALDMETAQLSERLKLLESAKLVKDIEKRLTADVKREQEERGLDEVRDNLMLEMEDGPGVRFRTLEAKQFLS